MSGSRRQAAMPPWAVAVVRCGACAGCRSGWCSSFGEVRLQRRLVGIDLGIASAHTVRVLDEAGREVCRRRCEPMVDSLTAIETAALVRTQPGTRLEVVIEPTGPA